MIGTRVFLDTMMFVYAADERTRWRPRASHIAWGGINQDIIVHQPVIEHPADTFDAALKAEVRLLPFIAFMAYRRRIELLWHAEGMMELWGAPNAGDPRGNFYGAPITHIPPPIKHGRVLLSASHEPLPPMATKKKLSQARHRQIAFMAGLSHPRFLQLRLACGADKSGVIDPGQLADAFHLWAAEAAGATHFMTGERKLLALATDSALGLRCVPVLPSELVAGLPLSVVQQVWFRMLLGLDKWSHPRRWHVAP